MLWETNSKVATRARINCYESSINITITHIRRRAEHALFHVLSTSLGFIGNNLSSKSFTTFNISDIRSWKHCNRSDIKKILEICLPLQELIQRRLWCRNSARETQAHFGANLYCDMYSESDIYIKKTVFSVDYSVNELDFNSLSWACFRIRPIN
jgi:hypothetical protein